MVRKSWSCCCRAVLSHQSEPILIADDDGQCVEASAGAGKLLGLSKSDIIGRGIDDLSLPTTVMNEVLPGHHLVSLHHSGGDAQPTRITRSWHWTPKAGLSPGTPERSAFMDTQAKRYSVNQQAASI